jgi:Holliday junction resolvase RusA-like endonuclease
MTSHNLLVTLPIPSPKLSRNYTPVSKQGVGMVRNLIKRHKLLAIEAINELKISGTPWQKVQTQETYYFKTNRRRDIRNAEALCKAYYDGFVEAGLMADDNHQILTHAPTRIEVDKDNPRLEILLTKLL